MDPSWRGSSWTITKGSPGAPYKFDASKNQYPLKFATGAPNSPKIENVYGELTNLTSIFRLDEAVHAEVPREGTLVSS